MWVDKLSYSLDKITRCIIVILLVVMFLIVFGSATLRYLFKISYVGSYDIARILFIWIIFLGASVVYRNQEHSRFVFLVSQLKGKVRSAFDLLMGFMASAFFLALVWYGLKLTQSARIQVLPASGVSAIWLYLPIVIGSVLMLLHGIMFMLRNLRELRTTAGGEGI